MLNFCVQFKYNRWFSEVYNIVINTANTLTLISVSFVKFCHRTDTVFLPLELFTTTFYTFYPKKYYTPFSLR